MTLTGNNKLPDQPDLRTAEETNLKQTAKAEMVILPSNVWHDKTFLIVEDIPSNFQLLAAYLSRTAAKIIHSQSGLQAFEIFKSRNDIDMILMDLQLPDINGLEITRMIREIDQNIPIIAQTAHALAIDRERSLNAGCNDYIAKPIRKNDFLAIVQQYIDANVAVN